MRTHISLKPKNFYDVYIWTIASKIKRIDLYLRTNRGITPDGAAHVLDITPAEVRRVMRELNIRKLNHANFFDLIHNGSSDICRYIQRESELCSPLIYSLDDVAYIYGLNIEDVYRASGITGIREATALTLPLLFCHIPAD